MAQHKRVDPGKTEEPEEVRRRKKKAQPQYDRVKTPDEGVKLQADLTGVPSIEAHGTMLSRATSTEQEADMITQLQQSYGNSYTRQVIERIQAEKGSGQPLEPEARSRTEAGFKQDFGDVRIHTDAAADELARELGAEAFTTGKDIFFREGAYQPGSDTGKGLLSHELIHVVQQSGTSPVTPGRITSPSEPVEVEARAEAVALDSGNEISVSHRVEMRGVIARQEATSPPGSFTRAGRSMARRVIQGLTLSGPRQPQEAAPVRPL
jgi:hypothetical protein